MSFSEFDGDSKKTKSQNSSNVQEEIMELIDRITQNTLKLSKELKKIGTGDDTHDFRHKLNGNFDKTTKTVIKLGGLVNSLKNDSDKTLYKKLSKQVKEVTTKFQDELTKSQKLQRDFIAKAQEEQKDMERKKRQSMMEMENTSEKDALLRKEEKQKQLMATTLENEIQHNNMLIRERQKDVKEIESSIIDLAQVVKELDIMVNEQQDSLDLISDRIETTGVHVEEGRQELVQGEKYDRCSKSLICWILVIVTCAVVGIAIGIVIFLTVMGVLR